MGERSRTADSRRRWHQWTEAAARAVLVEFAESGESLASFARWKGVSSSRLVFWRKRLGERAIVPTVPAFVQVRLPAARAAADGARIEIVVDDVSVCVREEMDLGRLAALVRALAGRERAC